VSKRKRGAAGDGTPVKRDFGSPAPTTPAIAKQRVLAEIAADSEGLCFEEIEQIAQLYIALRGSPQAGLAEYLRERGSVMSGARHPRQRPEAQLHTAVVEHLRLRAKPSVLWLHPPNGGARDARTGAMLKRMGVLPGAADLLLWHEGNGFALELKAPGGRLSEAQLEFLARFNDAGGHSACAEGIDRAIAVLEAWGLLVGRAT
jgi:VRR-NUC domain-containing protein